ncbi:MAG: esterase-like activity of phytase family protein [Cyanobacteriota bacterium]|nr:esterase-like activity of phytase family protein [Cyanobacteriota bacterium]
MNLKTKVILVLICIVGIIVTILINPVRLILAGTESPNPNFELIGQVTFPTGFMFQDTEVGGLSGITYNSKKQVYYAISDDRSSKAPARFYTLKIDLNSETLATDGVEIIAQTTLLNTEGVPFPRQSLDPEGIAFFEDSIFISSEGNPQRSQPPFIKEFDLTGKEQRSLPIPDKFLPVDEDRKRGIRNNLSLESLTLTPDKHYLFTATENALIQDGKPASPTAGSPCRILRYNLQTGQPDQEYLYISDRIVSFSGFPTNFQVNGLVDLLALDKDHLLALERSFALGVGNTIKLFKTALDSGDRIQGLDRLKGEIADLSPVRKTLLLNLNSLNLRSDNIEGLTFGPNLSDGRRSLILISDNNFNSLQVTQILALAVNLEPLSENSEK